ncbi:MAG: class IV adenylate cyclase [Gemmatimonadales bacterium]
MSGSTDELEVKARVENPDALVRALEAAGARLEYRGEMIDRRYDRDHRLSRRDEVLRLRVYRPAGDTPAATIPGVLGWKGKVRRRRGYRRREEWETRVADSEAVLGILERLGFEVVLRIDRTIAQYTLHGATVRLEWYPKMDVLVEVEGAPQAIERAVAATGLPRERFLPESLPYFIRAYERRTGARARLAKWGRGGGEGGGT